MLVVPILTTIEQQVLNGLTQQADSLRKLIVSEVNMFKNIEYDLLNISRQMEAVQPKSQLQIFVESERDYFKNPVISFYAEGPVAEHRYFANKNSYASIDLKTPIKRTLLEETLLNIDRGYFPWLLENKVLILKYRQTQL